MRRLHAWMKIPTLPRQIFSYSSLVRTSAIHGLERTVDPREVLNDPACPFPRSCRLWRSPGTLLLGVGVMLRAPRLRTAYLGRRPAEGVLQAGREDSHTRRETMTAQAPPNSSLKISTAPGSAKKRRGQTRSRVRMRCWRRTRVNPGPPAHQTLLGYAGGHLEGPFLILGVPLYRPANTGFEGVGRPPAERLL